MRTFLLVFLAACLTLSAQQIFGPNLIVNGDAEAGTGSQNDAQAPSIPGWTNKGANVIVYASEYGLSNGSIVPLGIGKNYFSSGKTNSSLTQTVNLAAGAAGVDAGTAVYTVSGFFGGYSDHDDAASLSVAYIGASGNALGSVTIGGVKSADRAGTGLYFRRQIGMVPVGTRSALVTLSFALAVPGSNNNAYADNLQLVLNTPASADSLVGRNLVVNGDAEAGLPVPPGNDVSFDVPGWVRTALLTNESYQPNADVDFTDPGPADRGKLLFLGGHSGESSNAYQDIDVSALAGPVDGGNAKFAFGAWIGGFADQNDNAVVTATFMDWAGKALGQQQLGPVLAAARNFKSGLLQRSANGAVPAGTRKVRILMTMTRTDGTYNDGLVDSITLVLSVTGATPAISPGGVSTAAAYGGSKAIAPGTWIEIYGQNLAPGAREWAGGDFAGNSAPTVLDGVRVTVGGQNAYVRYISPGQVNAQVPSGVGTGQQSLVVTTAGGSSNAYPITVNATQAGFLAPNSFLVNGRQYIAGLFADGGTFTIPANAIPGVSSRAPKAGETVILYGVGFGPTNPNIVAGQIVTQTNSLASAFQITIGGLAAPLSYSGLSPNFVGLYQFNVTIPAVPPAAAVPLVATLGGVPVTQSLFIAVGQ